MSSKETPAADPPPPLEPWEMLGEAAAESAPAAQPSETAPQQNETAHELPQDLATLKSMFPALELDVIQAVYTASGHNLDMAVPGLLQLSDPDAARAEETRPQGQTGNDGTADDEDMARRLAQAETDEALARRLQTEEEAAAEMAGAALIPPPAAEPGTAESIGQAVDRGLDALDDKLTRVGQRVNVAFDHATTSVGEWFGRLKKSLAAPEQGSGTAFADAAATGPPPAARDDLYVAPVATVPVSVTPTEQERQAHSSQYAALLDAADDEDDDLVLSRRSPAAGPSSVSAAKPPGSIERL